MAWAALMPQFSAATYYTPSRLSEVGMPVCKGCKEEVDELTSVKVDGRTRKLCEDCVELAEEQQAIAEESEAAVQQMMGFKGRR